MTLCVCKQEAGSVSTRVAMLHVASGTEKSRLAVLPSTPPHYSHLRDRT